MHEMMPSQQTHAGSANESEAHRTVPDRPVVSSTGVEVSEIAGPDQSAAAPNGQGSGSPGSRFNLNIWVTPPASSV